MTEPVAAAIRARLKSPAVRLHRQIVWTQLHLQRSIEKALAPLGLSTAKFYILLTLGQTEGQIATPTQIGRQLALERVNLTAIMDRMERDDLIRRERHPSDRRSCLVRLTDYGYDVLDRAITLYLPAIDELLARLDTEEKDRVRASLEKIYTLQFR
ncbi:MAG: MarR family transcriptional regulator [Chloroflexota bacterium]|nr:MarR family transcriptional regulator [Dehalococcoidia bacterium]MDW8253726.1 MarR family transcriptional regulator [Chloroflexota bacterium]